MRLVLRERKPSPPLEVRSLQGIYTDDVVVLHFITKQVLINTTTNQISSTAINDCSMCITKNVSRIFI